MILESVATAEAFSPLSGGPGLDCLPWDLCGGWLVNRLFFALFLLSSFGGLLSELSR